MILLDAQTFDNLTVINAQYQRIDQRTGEQIQDARLGYVLAYLGSRAEPGEVWEGPFTHSAGFIINGVFLGFCTAANR